jgi:NitT/TauT family transport system ATP-binding protein
VSASLAIVPRAQCDVAGGAPALTVQKVGLAFGSKGGRAVLDDISFDVREGEFLCIVGPSGCGKTTLLRLLAGLLQPTSGEIRFQGQRVSGPSRSRAIVFQDYPNALLPWRTVAGNVALSLEACGVERDQRAAAIGALLAKMGLQQAAGQFPSQLSGGMQQRVQIARCLAQQPKIMLMDEPFGALDAITRQTLQDELLAIAAERHMTVVFITHDLEEAIYLGDRVIVLGTNPGHIAERVDVDLPRPRNQLTTREDFNFLSLRHRLFGMLQGH